MKKLIYWELAAFVLIMVITSSFISSFNVEHYFEKEYLGSYYFFYLNQKIDNTGKSEILKNIYTGVYGDGKIKIIKAEYKEENVKVKDIFVNPPPCYYKDDVPVETAYISGDIIYVGNYFGKIYYCNVSNGNILGQVKLSAINLNIGIQTYRIIRGDYKGDMWLYFQGANGKYIAHINNTKSAKIWSYKFKGYLEQAAWWNKGIILEFAHDGNYTIYYFKNGTVKWKINITQSSTPNITHGLAIHGGNIYSYAGHNLSVYRDGLLLKKYKFSENIFSIEFAGNNSFLFTSLRPKTFLYVLDSGLNVQHRTLLFDFNWTGSDNYTIINQRAAIYLENKESYIVYLYTYPSELIKNKMPIRIIYLNKRFVVTGRELMSIYLVSNVFPSFKKNSIIEKDEFGDFYIAHSASKTIFESWLFVPVAIASVPAALYLYLKYPGERKTKSQEKTKTFNKQN